ncbi:hypothetical protein ACHAXR_007764 [Thalassiosira sp. AJA248-18]
MKISTPVRLSAFLLAVELHLGRCDAARIGSSRQENLGRNEVANYQEKEYVRDETKSIVTSHTYTNKERKELTCNADERTMHFSLTTDKYGYETKVQWHTEGSIFAFEPHSDENFADSTTYDYSYCVKIGQQYQLRIKDIMGDGLCCEFGQGSYNIRIDDEIIYDSLDTQGQTFTTVGTHTFVVEAPQQQIAESKISAASDNSRSGCITVRVKADKHPEELKWTIMNKNGIEVAASPALKALAPVSKQVCLPKGKYEFRINDQYGDGLCCGEGDGNFAVELDGKELIRGSHFQFTKSFNIQINPSFRANMSPRDMDWLVAHNDRRKKYHEQWGASYVPLKWSPQLAAESKLWAEKLLDDCDMSGIEHEKGVLDGENLAKNRGSGKFGELYPTENILTRWVERELDVGYPANAHLTQCLWRSSKFLGCGEAVKKFNGGRGTCRIQVCRYARAGNCNMNQHKASIGNNWLKPMLEDNTRCGPECAPEGCWSAEVMRMLYI